MNNTGQNNYQQQMITLFNRYLSNVAVLINKLYNLHWNIEGPFFYGLHDKFEEYYDELHEIFDEVAERIKQFNGYPIANLKQYNETSQIKSIESKPYNEREAVMNLVNDFEYMIMISNQIINNAGEVNDEATIVLFGEYTYFFQKELWMLKANLK